MLVPAKSPNGRKCVCRGRKNKRSSSNTTYDGPKDVQVNPDDRHQAIKKRCRNSTSDRLSRLDKILNQAFVIHPGMPE